MKLDFFSLFILVDISLCNVCTNLNSCNGHGTCNTLKQKCECFDGFGSDTDISDGLSVPISADCSEYVCPKGLTWGEIPDSTLDTINPAHRSDVECSGKGLCNRANGVCACFTGFEGAACQRSSCETMFNGCSGHGKCLALNELSTRLDSLPLTTSTEEYTGLWDNKKIRGCLCDSSWNVGLASGETQASEYFGADCSLKRCPSGDDPMTSEDETNCKDKRQDKDTLEVTSHVGESNVGAEGNLCHIDCSNRGLCDHEMGLCSCFAGYSGNACEKQDVLSEGF
eukprot:snap_masked-scaffold_2-processed-gene-20.12-mRNA-1 protein AED:0.01 eAED:0.01 QI:0/-1/0/1/-1/1/1/0/282